MKQFLLILCFLITCNPIISQSFSRVRVFANNEQIKQLEKAGVCLDHGKHKFNTWVETDLSIDEIEIIKANGIKAEIMIEDVIAHYQSQSASREMRAVGTCDANNITYNTPTHFKLGSMGGYPTYTQVISDLDSMFLLYPSLVKQKAPIGSFLTHDGFPVHWMKISNNPLIDESEPEILITALHHAREPGSITQLLYFMWYLLENYGTNPEITYLIDNTEIFFIPMINPDGYMYNESIAPGGGGMWRKNRRDNLDATFGVDLNRNYAYEWGTTGTSTTTSSDVYCGVSAFSEPETQAVRDFVIAHNFKLALNYHTYGNLLLFPYGYDYVDAPDKDYFELITSLMVSQNGFVNESAVTLYPASGDSDDWFYGDTIAKPRVFAMTPEVGSTAYGFWPPSSEIETISASTLFQNITALNLLHYYCYAKDANEEIFRELVPTHYFKFNLQKLGLETLGTSTVNLLALSPEITATGSAKTFTNLTGYPTILDSIDFTIALGTAEGTQLKFILQTTNASGTINDTVVKYYGNPTTIYSSDFTTLTAFTNSGWLTSTTEFVSPSSSLTESPIGNYLAFANKSLTSPNITIPATSLFAQFKFQAKWAIEKGYDYAQVLISTDGGSSFDPICGKYTSTGTVDQDEGEPLYDGIMSDWVLEEINLNNYFGATIQLKIIFKSDPGVQLDGFYMDDLVVEIIDANGINEVENSANISLWPNPVINDLNVRTRYANQTYVIYDNSGREILSGKFMQGDNIIKMDRFANGNYTLSVDANGLKQGYKISIIR
jgi:carboxypeptidase T